MENDKKPKVYFNIRANSRERMWDTTKYAGEVCKVLLPKVKQQASVSMYHKLHNVSKERLIAQLKNQISQYLINQQNIDISIAKKADLVYLWGAFPKNSNKSFILELDNPYVPAYYQLENFKRNKNKIKAKLNQAYKITYLSKASKNHTLALLGSQYEDKSFVNYPYMADNYKKNRRNDRMINFVFVGLQMHRKGGYELLEAFSHSQFDNIHLTFISNTSDTIQEQYKNDTRITILPAQPREVLLNEIYPTMDIMIFPSLHESFGVVLLEALSFGMGIITVNTYATPELVQDQHNGRLLHHPILKPDIFNSQSMVNCVDLKIKDFINQYLSQDQFYYGLYDELKNAITQATTDYKDWQENSLKLFNSKFSSAVWLKNFKKILS